MGFAYNWILTAESMSLCITLQISDCFGVDVDEVVVVAVNCRYFYVGPHSCLTIVLFIVMAVCCLLFVIIGLVVCCLLFVIIGFVVMCLFCTFEVAIL